MSQTEICYDHCIEEDIAHICQIDEEINLHKELYHKYHFYKSEIRKLWVDNIKILTAEKEELLIKCGIKS